MVDVITSRAPRVVKGKIEPHPPAKVSGQELINQFGNGCASVIQPDFEYEFNYLNDAYYAAGPCGRLFKIQVGGIFRTLATT